MAAYGVAIEQRWPESFPPPSEVVLALFDSKRVNSPLGNPEFEHATVVDLDTIRAIEEFQREPQRATVHDLKNVKIDHRVWQFSILGVLASIVLLVVLPERWADARIITGILLGAAASVGVVPFLLNVITVPRNGLAKEQYLPREKSPKNTDRPGNRLLG